MKERLRRHCSKFPIPMASLCQFIRGRSTRGRMGRAKGVALIMVLWVIAILSVVALEFSFGMRTEANMARHFKDEIYLYGLAEAGLYRTVLELIYKHHPILQQKRRAMKEGVPPEKEEWITDGRPYLLRFSQGRCEVRVMAEDGKININLVSESLLRKIIGNMGLEDEARDEVISSIMDWRDPDDFYRLNGAENDYYRSLPDPYDCKNGNLDSIEELLLIKGVTRELFYGKIKKEDGGRERVGLKDLFSVYSFGEQIDLNSASFLVMRMALGIPEEMARLIVKAREEKRFESQQDLVQRVPEIAPLVGEIGRQILYQPRSPYYTIEAKAKGEEGDSIRGLKAIVKIDTRQNKGYKIIQWMEGIQ